MTSASSSVAGSSLVRPGGRGIGVGWCRLPPRRLARLPQQFCRGQSGGLWRVGGPRARPALAR